MNCISSTRQRLGLVKWLGILTAVFGSSSAMANMSDHSLSEAEPIDALNIESNGIYGLVIEPVSIHETGELAGLTTYRMSLQTPNNNDIFSAMFGDEDLPFIISTTTSFYQTPGVSELLGSSINPLIFSFVPNLEFDSWLTVGLDSAPGENEEAPMTIGESNNGWETLFESGGDVVIADAIGGSVFLLNSPGLTNNVSGEDQSILLGQFTTDGEISGTVNVQMFTEGVVNPSDRITIDFEGEGFHPAVFIESCGCMDPGACNYDPVADCEDGSCLYLESSMASWAYFPVDDTIACDELMPTIEETMPVASEMCDSLEVVWVGDGPFDYPFGCLQSYTCPRVYLARTMAGDTLLMDTLTITVLDSIAPSFFYPTEAEIVVNESLGEMVPVAEAFVTDNCDTTLDAFTDYDVTETTSSSGNGTETIERTYTATDACGNVATFHQTITVIQNSQGCTDPLACNYNEEATDDDGSCVYADAGLDCDGNCLLDEDGDGICDPEIVGCTDIFACNYSPDASGDDGSCDYCSCEENPGAGFGLLLEELVVHPDTGELAGMTTYRMYVTTPNENDVLSAIYGEEEIPLVISTTTSFYHTPGVSELLGSSINPFVIQFFPNLAYDSWVTIGLDEAPGDNEQAPGTIGNSNNGWEDNFEAGQDILMQDSIGGAIFILNDAGITNGISGEDQRILIGQFTTDGLMSGLVNVQLFPQGMVDGSIRLTFPFEGIGSFASDDEGFCGCTDETACNYWSGAIYEDGSCEYAESPCQACDGTCLQDSDGDGVCDCLEFPGCMDETACNYDPIYTDDAGNCYYAELYFDCDGECLVDTDGDGVCDPLEIPGCTDSAFCDYNPSATDDDGTCGTADQINDVCQGAASLSCGETLLMNNEECATIDDEIGCAANLPPDQTAGLWFTFEGTGDSVTVTTCLPGTEFDTYLSVYEGSCSDLSCVAGNDDQSEATNFDDFCVVSFVASTVTIVTEEGQTYFALVSGVWNETGNFEVGLSCVIGGCTDSTACNYEESATTDDGSCEYESCVGCTDPEASNYNPLATISANETCQYCDLLLSTTIVQDLTCAGDSNAVVQLSMTNVTYPDSLEIYLNGEQVQDSLLEGLSAGTYTLLVTEGGSCSALLNFSIDDAPSLNILAQVGDVPCSGDSSGMLTINVTNGAVPIEFVLTGEDAQSNTSGNFSGLPAGSYQVEATDANGCQGILEVTIGEPSALELTAVVTDANGVGTGAIDLTISGGTEPYEISWMSDDVVVSSAEDLTGLDGPATYEVLVVDANGCEAMGGPYNLADVSVIGVLEADVLTVYPNPAREWVHVELDGIIGSVDCRVYDATGRAVVVQKSTSGSTNHFTLDVADWPAGSYHLRILTKKGAAHVPLIIQH